MTSMTPERDHVRWSQAAAATIALLENHKRSVEAFRRHDAAAVGEAYAADAVVRDPAHPEPLRGRAAIRDDYARMFESFPDIVVTVRRVFLSGSSVAYALTLRGTNAGPISTPEGTLPATGRPYEVEAAVVAEADATGRYRRVERYYDVAGALRQLGLGG
jgi:steroid delta-isomerase-like uncharacterized protein